MPAFYDSQGNSYALNQQIGRGGEGPVFFCPNDLSLVAKIYHASVDAEKAEKLRWMAENKNDQLLKVAAWIVDVLTDESGNVVGFLMPNVKAKEIHELYSLKSRRVHFPEATWQFLIHTAANVARAFYSLHKNEHIMGDVNHGNCVVLADGTVKLIDCDSYSIKTDKMRYACEVGVATHLAPELQGADLSCIERENKHDNFGLAVIIFQLLFLGRHPFAGNYTGAEDKSLEDCIREHRFAYGSEEITNVKQPPGTLSLVQIPPRLAVMFERAFFTEERPEPREWIESLEDLSASLKQCSVHIGHHYFNELFACPWCEIESKTGLMLFPFVSSGKNSGEQGFNIFTIENLLASLEIPQNLPAKTFKPTFSPLPSTKARELRTANKTRLIGVSMAQFLVVFGLTIIIGAGVGFLFGIFMMLIFFAVFHSLDKPDREEFKEELQNVRQEWSKLDDDWKNNHKSEQLNADLALVRTRVAEHQSLQRQSRDEMKRLNGEVFQYKLNRYLSSFRLADAKISGIEEKHKDILKSCAIKTAADVELPILQFYSAIDQQTGKRLLNWRKNLEKDFEFSPETELPEADKNRFALQFTDKRGKIEKDIEQLLVTLRSGSLALKHYQNQMAAKSEKLAQRLLQAESNAATVGGNGVLIVVLISITGLIPMFGAAFQSSSPRNEIYSNPRTVTTNSYSNFATNTAKVSTDDDNYQVVENLTDSQIQQFSLETREKSAKSLLKQATKLISEKKIYEAKGKLQYALKFNPIDVDVHYEFGLCLYKNGEKERAEAQYHILADLDGEKAEKLLQETGMKVSAKTVKGVGVGQGDGIGSGYGTGSGR